LEINTFQSGLDESQKNKKVITLEEKLIKRIKREFERKKFIGDIQINDDEFETLMSYFREQALSILRRNVEKIIDPVYCVALVQIGIKYYDGNFWRHVKAIIGTEYNSNYTTKFGESFMQTLKKFNKLVSGDSDRVNTILMHGFVADRYASNFFNFLFAYYRIDLERDLTRNKKEFIDALFEVMQRNDNTGRTYFLVKQTSDAIRLNARGSKIRIRRYLRLIDKAFWDEAKPPLIRNRLTRLFWEWKDNSKEFATEFNRFNGGNRANGKRSFSTPYLKCEFKGYNFKVIIPTQIVKFSLEGPIIWRISTCERELCIEGNGYEAVTGIKTDEVVLSISDSELFGGLIIDLYSNNEKIKLFRIKSEDIRIFDKDGDFIRLDSVPEGEAFTFSKLNFTPISDALVETDTIRNMNYSYFDFQNGDIVRLPDGKPLSIGKKIQEGLQYRNLVKGAFAFYNSEKLPVYNAAPTVLIKIKSSKCVGTLIRINEKPIRIFQDHNVIDINLMDRSGETGYILNLKEFCCVDNNIYEVLIDVPNDRTDRMWRFALANGLDYTYQDSPYIFKPRGTISFCKDLHIRPIDAEIQKNEDENSFNFEISPSAEDLSFTFVADKRELLINFVIPSLKYKFGNGTWQIQKPNDIWHSDFPTKVYFKYPSESLKIRMEESETEDDTYDDQEVTYRTSKSQGLFDCDMTRFKSWFSRETAIRKIYIVLNGKSYEFFGVVTKSTVAAGHIRIDSETEKIIGEFDIIGNANYYADILFRDTLIAEKVIIKDGKLELNTEPKSGKYIVKIFEDELDDTGFGDGYFYPIGEYCYDLLNPNDLSNRSFEIKCIKKGEQSIFNITLKCEYFISHLELVNQKNKHIYRGYMTVQTVLGERLSGFVVTIEFYNLNNLKYAYITFPDNEDELEFLYDENRHIIVKEPEKGLTRAEEYRRYKQSLFPEDYVYVIDFVSKESDSSSRTKNSDNPISVKASPKPIINIQNKPDAPSLKTISAIDEPKEQKQYIEHNVFADDDTMLSSEDIGLPPLIYNCLKKQKIHTVRDVKEFVRKKGIKGLNNIQLFNSSMREQLLDALKNYGIEF